MSYNQPKFSSCARWYSNASTFANESLTGVSPSGIFVDTHNTVYMVDTINSRVHVWLEGDTAPVRTLSTGIIYPSSVFVGMNDDIYVDNTYRYGRVDQWFFNATNGIIVMNVNKTCYGLFIDANGSIYCSMGRAHAVAKRLFKDTPSSIFIVAGTGSPGTAPNQLTNPQGIFVDLRLNLYVADCFNDRMKR